MNKHIDNYPPEEFINLFDVYKKVVQYKKVFWSVFFAVFVVGSCIVLFTLPRYNFSQVIEIGKSPDEKGDNMINVNLDETIRKIKKVFFPAAIRAYNLQASHKIYISDRDLTAENVGNGSLLLSMNGPLKNSDVYRFIFKKIIEGFSNDTKEYIEYRKKNLTDTKVNLERRLAEINNFYKAMSSKYFAEVSQKKDAVPAENKIITMYLNDQSLFMIQLANNISMLQAQIIGTYNTRIMTDVIVSDRPVGMPKYVALVLVALAALFLAFFGVFVTGLDSNWKKY